jgi:hypothetical protein
MRILALSNTHHQHTFHRWQDAGRLRGYGHVMFDSAESRAKAVDELNGMHLGA